MSNLPGPQGALGLPVAVLALAVTGVAYLGLSQVLVRAGLAVYPFGDAAWFNVEARMTVASIASTAFRLLASFLLSMLVYLFVVVIILWIAGYPIQLFPEWIS